MAFQTEFEFTLPRGYVDEQGTVHTRGAMRLATALDEITPLRDPRVRNNEAYLVVLLLAQVIRRLGTLPAVTPAVIEKLYAADMAYLQDFYRQINDVTMPTIEAVCPNCGHTFEVELPPPGEL
ncbi:MAG: phage tail assembly protein [Anaerolineae bacterium]|jgi:hypothetical protein|nr:phage tail assembly protein [Anaerolineae bacterium]